MYHPALQRQPRAARALTLARAAPGRRPTVAYMSRARCSTLMAKSGPERARRGRRPRPDMLF